MLPALAAREQNDRQQRTEQGEGGATQETGLEALVDDFQALMCGLSATIERGVDPARYADLLLDALRPT